MGDHGVVLRYAKQDQSLERAASDVSLDYAKLLQLHGILQGHGLMSVPRRSDLRMRAAEDGGGRPACTIRFRN